MLIRIEKPRYALISSAFVSHTGIGPSPWCEAERHAAAYLFVSTTMWSISWVVKKERNISVGSAETATVGPVGRVNVSTDTVVKLLDHSFSIESGSLLLACSRVVPLP